MSNYSYCSKGHHPESSCMKKKINMLTQLLEKHNISLPEGTKKKERGPSFEDKERVHALVASTLRSPSFIIDFGASRHMDSTRQAFLSLDDSNGPKLLLGDNSETESKGKGSIDFDHGSFNNVLYVPSLAANILLCILESTSLCYLEHFLFFPWFHLLVRLLSRDGGLKWWRPRWRTQFLRFADVSTEVVTIVIYDLY